MIKVYIKKIMGIWGCLIRGIRMPVGGCYIGRNVKISGGKNIHIGRDVTVRPYSEIWCNTGQINIGDGTEIGEKSRISIANSLIIQENVLLSPNVYITDCDHEYRDISIPIIRQGIVKKDNKVEIGEGSYIGINSVIIGNITIGKHCIIGANSVVTKDVEDFTVVAGIPAKIIRRFNVQTNEWECPKT